MNIHRKAQGKMYTCRRLTVVCLVLFYVLSLASCKNKTPDDIISPGKMEEILFDYHMAEAVEATMPGDRGENKGRFVGAVFEKYAISREEFSHSMAYYFRHTDKLSVIYTHLRERYGGLIAGADHSLPDLGIVSDTLNIWNGPSAYILSNQGENKILYEVKADSSFHPEDRIIWSFNSSWMFHDGAKNIIAVIKAEYANDSVATATRNFFSSGKQEISLTLGRASLRRIVCMAYMASPWTEKPRLAIIDKPVLMRARIAKLLTIDESSNPISETDDSVKLRNIRELEIRDSLVRDERDSRHRSKSLDEAVPMQPN